MVSSISPTPHKRALVDGKNGPTRVMSQFECLYIFLNTDKYMYVIIWKALLAGQYIFESRVLTKGNLVAKGNFLLCLEWEMQNHLANVNFPGYWV